MDWLSGLGWERTGVAGIVEAGTGSERRGRDGHGCPGWAGNGGTRTGVDCTGKAVMERQGAARTGMDGHGPEWLSWARLVEHGRGEERTGAAVMDGAGTRWRGLDRRAEALGARIGVAVAGWHGMDRTG